MLSSATVAALSDLIENRLAAMSISDQDDLREKLTLQQALIELHAEGGMPAGVMQGFEIPRRGRRRKIGSMAGGAV